MGTWNIRLPLLAVIISCCITWTSSLHHYSHHVLRHRSRHRRQGAGLFLPQSFVIPGGEGYGPWGQWGEVSPCSRTCGGGVASQKRICLEIGASGQPSCVGGDTKYFSCETQDCPAGSKDFRELQCAEYNSIPFRNSTYYDWIPYTRGPNPCELICRPRNERFHHPKKLKVVDGTRCSEDSFDVCVDGACQHVGCDMMLGSDAREDKCRVCRGNGTDCRTFRGLIDNDDLILGYNDVLLIPQGATNIVIAEIKASNNYLALRSKTHGQYYLNGDYHIDFPHTVPVAGALWQYEREQQGFPAPDKLRSLGPTNEPLYLSLLLQDTNVGIEYEYSIANTSIPPPDQQYSWVYDAFSPCSASCGGGVQNRNVSCRSREELEVVEDSLCDPGLKPVTSQTCSTQACAARWVSGPWSPCSQPCGQGGSKSREVHCEKIITNGYPSIVEDNECYSQLGPKPELYQPCNQSSSSCPTWFTGPWKHCDKLCGEGKQSRQVVCHQKVNGRVEIFEDNACTDEKPPTEQKCILHPCEGVDWVLSDWSGCDNCLSKVRTRQAECATKHRVVVDAKFCANHPKPVLEEPCDRTKLPPCTVQWYATQWSNCSVQCGKGVQTRRLFCGLFDGASVIKVDDSRCSNETKYNDTKPCEIPEEKCPSKWFAGPWSECTKLCGGGQQFRRVMCLRGSTEVSDCDSESILDAHQKCNTGPCDKDETIPVDVTAVTVMDDYDDEECEDEDYPEEGLEEESEGASSPFEDMMFSDSPSTGFTEEGSGTGSTLSETTETGSGSEPTLSTETLITEASGSGPTETTETGETSATSESSQTESESSSSDGSTETTITGSTDSSGSTETSETDLSSSTESSVSSTSESITSDSTEASSTEGSSTEGSSTDGSSTEGSSSEGSTAESTTESVTSPETDSTTDQSTTAESSTFESSTDGSSTTEIISSSSDSLSTSDTTESSVSESGSTETSETETSSSSDSTESSMTTETDTSGSTETTESGLTETTGSAETTESGLTDTTETGGTTESGLTETTESGPTTESGSTEITETTESGATEESESSTTSEGSTPWDWSSTIEVFTKKPHCKKRRRPAKCIKSKFGCCPDKRTPASGPFDDGCPNPKTCAESKFGCCPDGVSPAQGPNNLDCEPPACNETLYGCCKSDNKTPSQGNDQEGCPPPPPKCKSSKFGCCKDGETEAKGPKRKGCPENQPKTKDKTCVSSPHGCCHDNKTAATGPNGEGCPCNATEFGCCPDNVSPAHGPQLEGCVLSCNTSAYGCCPDGETPAHGPGHTGCCLLYSFGCCPDNYKPAEGPRLEGCGCQYSQYGCCPDRVTSAKGPNKEGCGCQYSEHGCCPDRHTEASGPNFEGCACHTYQFGCCPDGETIAKGPNLQGCHCSSSQFGCCGDEQTPAQGPDRAGCDCASSKYGCCPDGQTEAKGFKFLGCTDIPVNRQADCSLSTERGSCTNYTVVWYFDMQYGGCSRFWYGGCEGNGNRFANQQECEEVCVHPPKKDKCKLPKVKGVCDGFHLHWYYDTEREQCQQFVYGGCVGNDNNFDTREACVEECEPVRAENQCKLPLERGSCSGNFNRWGYNVQSGRCEQFIWGGCEGNANRFGSEAACNQHCNAPGVRKPQCELAQTPGTCSEKHARWSFSSRENRCVPFYYSGCDGNENNFQSEEECSDTCPSSYEPDTCALPAETGTCAEYSLMWYYDTKDSRCRQFYYGGCGGNGNRFASEQECTLSCDREQLTTTTTRAPERQFAKEDCFLSINPGPCRQSEQRWAFDQRSGSCVSFVYGGCLGNGNNFPSQEHCQYYCGSIEQGDICQLPMSAGPCAGSETKWFYDAGTDSCSQFAYGGCEGNGNRFDDREQCESRCRTVPQQVTQIVRATTPQPEETLPEVCQESGMEPCNQPGGEVWYYEPSARECAQYFNADSGDQCKYRNTFKSQEACERNCGTFRGIDVCRAAVDPGPCSEQVHKFFYNASAGQCQQFTYGGCTGGANRFSSSFECEEVCHPRVPSDPCSQDPDQGGCSEYELKWSYNRTTGECLQLYHGTCRNSANKFNSQEECEGRCRAEPQQATPPVQTSQGECSPPPQMTPCGAAATSFYFDPRSGSCRAAPVGNCGFPGTYTSEEECERYCGQFRGVDVCRAALDPGPCRALIPKYFYNAATGACQPYHYSGCGGGANRFSTIDECERTCADVGPGSNTNEVLPDCDAYEAQCSQLQCQFGVQRLRTADGCNRCICVTTEVDCNIYADECAQLQCDYGVDKSVGPDGCERCTCLDHPCAQHRCASDERCVVESYAESEDTFKYKAQCRLSRKPGECPALGQPQPDQACTQECYDDADCAGAARCCQYGCRSTCQMPVTRTYTTGAPDVPQAPVPNPETPSEVEVGESGKATLRCLFHSNPPPKITWQRGEVTIDGEHDRYRILLDGTLEIVSLYRNDSGVYICVAQNEYGTSRQEITLQVSDPVEAAAEITGDENASVIGELGESMAVRCLAYGYPPPTVTWHRGVRGPMVPYSSHQYEVRDQILLIRSLDLETIGDYTCEAYNGNGKPASWSLQVLAYRPDGLTVENAFLVDRVPRVVEVAPRVPQYWVPPPPPQQPEQEVPVAYMVPVSTRLVAPEYPLRVAEQLSLSCDVDGYPTPAVHWTKDGERLGDGRYEITESRLTIRRLTLADAGSYGCHAINNYSSHSSTVTIAVEESGESIPSWCYDNPEFANCNLIVQSKFCVHKYYSKFCCKSCVEDGQLTLEEAQKLERLI